MQFQSKIVVGNKNPKARIAWAGGALLFLAMVLTCVDGLRRYGFWLMGLAVVVLAVGLIAGKGDVDVIAISETDIVVSAEDIRVGELLFRVSDITDIVWQVEGYDGMVDAEGYSGGGSSGNYRHRVNGVNNYLNFRYDGLKQEWQFYLQDPEHVQVLGALFKEWYAKGIPFLERGVRGNRTFLFAPVSKEGWEEMMREHGYQLD
jgi:hypothetical protein